MKDSPGGPIPVRFLKAAMTSLKTVVATCFRAMGWDGSVPTSVMPKGVEHVWTTTATAWWMRVPTSVMPKGVEHIQECPHVLPEAGRERVPTSVMPKGVEHHPGRHAARSAHWGADLCDAERR